MKYSITRQEANEILEKQFFSDVMALLFENENWFNENRHFASKWFSIISCGRHEAIQNFNVAELFSLFSVTKNDTIVFETEYHACFDPFIYYLGIKDTNKCICFTKDIKEINNRIKEYRQPIEKKCEHPILTYIMIDENIKGIYKIGKSVNPEYRERTLQGEKPTIKLAYICKNNVETKIHREYYKYRVRGEWFKLTENQLSNIVIDNNFVSS